MEDNTSDIFEGLETKGGNGADSVSGGGSDYEPENTNPGYSRKSPKPKPPAKRKSNLAKKTEDKRAHIIAENWTEELASTLIAQVEQYPAIWDVNSADMRNKTVKDSAWVKVRTDGGLTHITDAECRRKWQNLCNNNNKLANAYYTAVSGESAKKTPNWVHWTAMEFVRKNKASYKMSTQSNLETDETESALQTERSNDGKAKRRKRQASSTSTRTPTPMSTATGEALEKLDALIDTIGEGQSNPHLAESKEWAAVLNQMAPMYATRAKSEIKAVLSKYFRLSATVEEEAAEKQYRSELAKTSMCIMLEFDDCGVKQPIFVLGNDLEKLDLSRHTMAIVFKADGELIIDPVMIQNVEAVVGLRSPSILTRKQPEGSITPE